MSLLSKITILSDWLQGLKTVASYIFLSFIVFSRWQVGLLITRLWLEVELCPLIFKHLWSVVFFNILIWSKYLFTIIFTGLASDKAKNRHHRN